MTKGLLIVPDWERENFSKLSEMLSGQALMGSERRFSIGNSPNVSMGMHELIEKYGNKALQKAKRMGEKLDANVGLLYSRRGFGKLEVHAHYYSL